LTFFIEHANNKRKSLQKAEHSRNAFPFGSPPTNELDAFSPRFSLSPETKDPNNTQEEHFSLSDILSLSLNSRPLSASVCFSLLRSFSLLLFFFSLSIAFAFGQTLQKITFAAGSDFFEDVMSYSNLPVDIVLVRHGESEGNLAQSLSKKGNDKLWTPEFSNRHTSLYRLTDRGRKQAKKAGKWIKKNICPTFDHYYCSEYIR
jgi:hypothetical protein